MRKTCDEFVIDIQNGLLEAGFNEDEVAKVLNDMVKNADFAGIGKSMMAVLDGHARLKVYIFNIFQLNMNSKINFKIVLHKTKW